MKLIRIIIFVVFSFVSLNSWANDPKLRVFAVSAGYGVVAGTLLGTATLAFGGEGRNIAKGASLGLYAGLIFGAYVVTSYEMKKRGWGEEKNSEDYYPDDSAKLDLSTVDQLYANSRKEKEQTSAVLFQVPLVNLTF